MNNDKWVFCEIRVFHKVPEKVSLCYCFSHIEANTIPLYRIHLFKCITPIQQHFRKDLGKS